MAYVYLVRQINRLPKECFLKMVREMIPLSGKLYLLMNEREDFTESMRDEVVGVLEKYVDTSLPIDDNDLMEVVVVMNRRYFERR